MSRIGQALSRSTESIDVAGVEEASPIDVVAAIHGLETDGPESSPWTFDSSAPPMSVAQPPAATRTGVGNDDSAGQPAAATGASSAEPPVVTPTPPAREETVD